jgi:hypothetical protein
MQKDLLYTGNGCVVDAHSYHTREMKAVDKAAAFHSLNIKYRCCN